MSQAPVEINVETPDETPDETPEVVDTGDTIVVGGGEDSSVAIQTGENAARIEELERRNAELEAQVAAAASTAEVALDVALEAPAVAETVAEDTAEETAEEVAEEVAAEAERTDSEPGGTHWLFRPAREWRHGR